MINTLLMVPPDTTRLSTAGATSDYTARFSSVNGNQPFSAMSHNNNLLAETKKPVM
jgi:hypothetical protein